MWSLAEVHSAISAGLARDAADVEAEQAVRGIDSLDEIALQGMVANGLHAAGFEVHREVRYLGDRTHTRRSEGRRCDLVVTPAGRPLDEDAWQMSLFRPPNACPAGEALWIEVKVVAQFLEGRANRGYGAALQGPIWRDLEKLAADRAILHAAQLVLLFTADDAVADHDFGITLDRAAARGILLDTPHVARLTIGDRLGNARCTVALVGVRR
jgi:hypothetical protein